MAEKITGFQPNVIHAMEDQSDDPVRTHIPQALLDLSVPADCEVVFARVHPEAEVLAFIATSIRTDRELMSRYCGMLSAHGVVPVYVYGVVPPAILIE